MTAYRQRLIDFENQKRKEELAQAKAQAKKPATRKTTKPSTTSKPK
jgi:hypothetical protein